MGGAYAGIVKRVMGGSEGKWIVSQESHLDGHHTSHAERGLTKADAAIRKITLSTSVPGGVQTVRRSNYTRAMEQEKENEGLSRSRPRGKSDGDDRESLEPLVTERRQGAAIFYGENIAFAALTSQNKPNFAGSLGETTHGFHRLSMVFNFSGIAGICLLGWSLKLQLATKRIRNAGAEFVVAGRVHYTQDI
ncbi:hypothetical protein M407DRAFT_223359 [Tulasnella calospora MUT 4182]|uniref:Uncharacterized protein n=1 Tax=Tulasnella calospora MUT 4182 TaxID=1051891 RepID=A0A0C3QGA2_9AGAM|nr:hypothetical protein M407DRAFT_223359 [Tulasnella calospora MUT 4182]